MYEGDAVYVKSRCFDPFPFPEASESIKARIRATAEELDALRKRVQAEHPGLTLSRPRRSQWNIAVLLPGILDILVAQRGECPGDARSRFTRHDDVVDIAAFRRDVWR
jgi:hypothetical protein